MGYFNGNKSGLTTLGKKWPELQDAGPGDNPFRRGDHGQIMNISKLSELIKRDPERAKRLARAAGEPVGRWFPNNPR